MVSSFEVVDRISMPRMEGSIAAPHMHKRVLFGRFSCDTRARRPTDYIVQVSTRD